MQQHNNHRKRQKNSGSSFRSLLLGGAGLAVLLIFLVILFGSQEFGPVYKLLLDLTGPLQKMAVQVKAPFQAMKEQYLDLLTVREEKERLWQELQKCRTAAYANRGAVALNARLRKLLEFKESSDLPKVAARIIGKDPSPWFRSVIIDRGL